MTKRYLVSTAQFFYLDGFLKDSKQALEMKTKKKNLGQRSDKKEQRLLRSRFPNETVVE